MKSKSGECHYGETPVKCNNSISIMSFGWKKWNWSDAKKKVLSVLYAWDEKVKFKSKKKKNESEIEKKKKEGNISELYAWARKIQETKGKAISALYTHDEKEGEEKCESETNTKFKALAILYSWVNKSKKI